MTLTEHKRLFHRIRKTCEIVVRGHAVYGHPERGFTEREIVELVQKGNGPFRINNSVNAVDGAISYLFFPKDFLGRECKLVVVIEKNSTNGDYIIICSAYRE